MALYAVLAWAAAATGAAAACDPAVQHAALVEFHTATEGERWSEAFHWPVEESSYCSWTGVDCDPEECVVEIVVPGGLRGTLPEMWGDLRALQTLDLNGVLSFVKLGGPLPASFAELHALELLDLGFNRLTGSLDVLSRMPNLRDVVLSGNPFNAPLPQLAQPSLEVLSLSVTEIVGTIPPAYGRLPLRWLDMSHSQLTSSVPHELGSLPVSTFIDLSFNPNLDGLLPHTLLGRGGNMLFGGTSVTLGCDAGWAYNASSFSCTSCGPGFSTPAESYTETCVPCEPGTVAPAAGSVCEVCPAGTFADGAGNAECAPCPAGTVSGAGAGECVWCGPGLWSVSPASGVCDECPIGTFSDGAANTECAPCPAGLAATSKGASACEPCGAGSISVDGGAACSECSAGSSTDGVAAATSCTPCAAGTIAPEASMPLCEACAAGTTSNAIGTACDECPAGTSTEGANGAPSCLPCSAGSASDPGSATCEPCEPGTYGAEPGLDTCEVCPAGSTTEGATGALSCVACPAGSFSPLGNTANCSLCAAGSFADVAGQPECTVCPAGTHQPLAGSAAACPACRYPGRCREGNECAAGYSGAGCLFCAVDHFRLSNVCLSCPVIPWPLIVLLALGAALLHAASKNRLGARQTTVLKIVLFYVQMVVVVLALQVEWPSTQTGFVEAMSFASAEIGLPLAECYVSVGWYSGFAGSLAGPVGLILVFWMATMVVEWRRRRAWAKTGDATQDFALMGRASNMRRLWIAASAMMHLPLVRVLLGAFDCERDSNGDLVVAGSDDGTPCETSTHVAVQSLSGIALLVVGFVVPLLVAWFTLRLRRTDQLDAGEVQAAWGALYESYRPEYCFFEGVVAMRKVALTLTLVVPAISIEWRIGLLLVQSVVWAAFVLMRRPYKQVRGRLLGLVRRDDVINELEVVVSLVVILHQSTAGLAAGTNGGQVSLVAGVVLVIITAGVLVAALWQAARIGRGFEVAPTRFDQAKAERDQRKLFWAFTRAVARDDFDEAARVRSEGVRHARQTREFAEWRSDHSKVSTEAVPFLEMVIAEETTTPAELEAAVEAAVSTDQLIVELNRATSAGHFELARAVSKRLSALERSVPPCHQSRGRREKKGKKKRGGPQSDFPWAAHTI